MRIETSPERPRLVGINHVAIEVGSIDEALEFYGKILSFTLRSRGDRMAFIDIGDQFIALGLGQGDRPDSHRHFGLVVDSKEATRRALAEAGVPILAGRGLDFRDPWGNHVQIVEYGEIQFTKSQNVLRGMGIEGLEKTPAALDELRRKGVVGED